MRREHCRVRNAGINPDVDGVVAMARAFGQSELPRERCIIQLEPDVGATLRDEVGQLADPPGVQDGFAFRCIKNRQRHSPTPLPRDHPIRTRFYRPRDPVLTPRRNPAHIFDRRERVRAQIVDANKELLDRAEDDRRFRTPAIRIRMPIDRFADEHPLFAQERDDVGVRIENVFAREFRQTRFIGVAAVIVHRRQNWQPVLSTQRVIVFAVTGCDVHAARAGIHRDKVSGEDARVPRKKWVLGREALPTCCRERSQSVRRSARNRWRHKTLRRA